MNKIHVHIHMYMQTAINTISVITSKLVTDLWWLANRFTTAPVCERVE